jgi:hypothetical protein
MAAVLMALPDKETMRAWGGGIVTVALVNAIRGSVK